MTGIVIGIEAVVVLNHNILIFSAFSTPEYRPLNIEMNSSIHKTLWERMMITFWDHTWKRNSTMFLRICRDFVHNFFWLLFWLFFSFNFQQFFFNFDFSPLLLSFDILIFLTFAYVFHTGTFVSLCSYSSGEMTPR